MAKAAGTPTDAYKNADLVKTSVSRVLALKGKRYSDIISKAPPGSTVEELQWVDLVTAGELLSKFDDSL